jgi:hypothetical protein
MEIHLTLGDMELRNFENTQNSFIRAHLPHFVRVRPCVILFFYLLIGLLSSCNCVRLILILCSIRI